MDMGYGMCDMKCGLGDVGCEMWHMGYYDGIWDVACGTCHMEHTWEREQVRW